MSGPRTGNERDYALMRRIGRNYYQTLGWFASGPQILGRAYRPPGDREWRRAWWFYSYVVLPVDDLVDVGDGMTMHRSVLDRIDREWNKVFGYPKMWVTH